MTTMAGNPVSFWVTKRGKVTRTVLLAVFSTAAISIICLFSLFCYAAIKIRFFGIPDYILF